MATLQDILSYAVKHGASDIHLSVGSPAACRVDGKIRFFSDNKLTPSDTSKFLEKILTTEQREEYDKTGDADVAMSVAGLGRFRVNVLRQRGSVGIVIRHVRGVIQAFDDLFLPEAMEKISRLRRGLVLITGTTGSGKLTMRASIVDRINATRR